MRLEGHTSGVLDCTWSPDGTRLVTGSRDYKARLWDTATGEDLGKWSDNNCVRSVSWHPTENVVATSGVDKTLKFRNATTGSVLHTIDDGIDLGSIPMKSRFDHSGTYLVSGYGKAGTMVMYGPVGEVPDDGPDTTTAISGALVTAISIVGVALLIYPAIRKARRRR
jgi:WD40 repeat protein